MELSGVVLVEAEPRMFITNKFKGVFRIGLQFFEFKIYWNIIHWLFYTRFASLHQTLQLFPVVHCDKDRMFLDS